MTRKKSRQNSSNVVGDSSESDGSLNQEKGPPTPSCVHAKKSVDPNEVRKNLNLEDIANNNFCQQCLKEGVSTDVDDIFACLRCGAKACSLKHSAEHYKVPRSDKHSLALRLPEKTVWCHECGNYIDDSTSKVLKTCVSSVLNLYDKFLHKPTIKTSPKNSPVEQENAIVSNDLRAVPVLSPTKKPNEISSGVKGLMNLGNTCFFNSVLQCLAQTPKLIETLKEMEVKKEINIELSDRTLTGILEKQDNFAEHLVEVLSNIRGAGKPYSPQKLLYNLQKRVPHFKGYDQHDAHELLRHLLDSVRTSDIKRYRKILLKEFGLNGVDNDKVDPEKHKEMKKLDREVTEKIMFVPDQVFRGFLVSRLECLECHHSSECVESFLDLSLPVSSEKPHPPIHRRNRISDETGTTHMSKHQLKKERRLMRKNHRQKHNHHKKSDVGQAEAVPSIPEKGESDVDGDEGDLDSEDSGKVCEAGDVPNSTGGDELLCAGVPLTPQHFSVKCSRKTVSPVSSHATSNQDLPMSILLTSDISQLGLHDSSSPKLKTFVRDSETITREDPAGLMQLYEMPEAFGENPFSVDDHSNTPNSTLMTMDTTNDSPEGPVDELEKEDVVSSDDKTATGEKTSGINFNEWLNTANNEPPPPPSESIWDENATIPPFEPSLPNTSSESATPAINDENPNSDEEVNVSSLFDEVSGDSNGECTVHSCLHQFTGVELMTGSNSVGCESCTRKANRGRQTVVPVYTSSSKQLLISEAPPVLILHIKRFQVHMSSFRKLSRHVAFPFELDISPYCKKETVQKSPTKLVYSLYGVVEHSGNFNGGHYVAYVKVDNKWFYISDSHVSDATESRVLKAQAYLLFYKLSS